MKVTEEEVKHFKDTLIEKIKSGLAIESFKESIDH